MANQSGEQGCYAVLITLDQFLKCFHASLSYLEHPSHIRIDHVIRQVYLKFAAESDGCFAA